MQTLSRLVPYISRSNSRISRILAQKRESKPLPGRRSGCRRGGIRSRCPALAQAPRHRAEAQRLARLLPTRNERQDRVSAHGACCDREVQILSAGSHTALASICPVLQPIAQLRRDIASVTAARAQLLQLRLRQSDRHATKSIFADLLERRRRCLLAHLRGCRLKSSNLGSKLHH
eukprot:SAG31_NODE_9839_length_1221_cov_2.335116_2_plen_175_part_00